MKIIILGPAHPYRGGIADTNEALCRALNKNGHQTSIVTFRLQYPSFLFPGKTQYSKEKVPKDLDIRRLINSANPFNWIKVAKSINSEQPDVVIVRYWIPLMAPCFGTIARSLNKDIIKIALTDNVLPHEKRFGDRAFTKYFLRPFDAFVTLSTTVRDELKQFTNKPILYSPHPINEQLGAKIDKPSARKKLGLNITANYVLFFGLIRKYKGLDMLLEAFGNMALKKNDIHLLVVGEFYDDQQRYRKLVNEFEIEDRVMFIDEFVPFETIAYYFSAVDLVAQTYHTASQSGVTPIAYHFERPMLVTNVGGLAETIPDGKVGYVVDRNPAAISEAIIDFFENDRVDDFTMYLKEEKRKYSWHRFVASLIEFTHTLRA
ncbi:glycosyltransferase [Sungkyunkwania multivorans]|uniref:Glycosyltransferase n=1 Tax=Sungkyunkwania multivorans TaxID=1173618 RepID=A0ABW3CUK6_9FLAO